jgi:S-adenosylmethionine synthetase
MSRVACETLVTTGLVVVAGEITTSTYVDIPTLVREKIAGIGYTRAKFGFDAATCGVIVSIDPQSDDIAVGVDRALEIRDDDKTLDEIGAGDQGMMFGYACEETEELMPLPITLAHALTRRLSEVRKSRTLDYLRPDGKSQVTVRYEGDRPVAVEKVLISAQHRAGAEATIRDDLMETVILPVMPQDLFDPATAEVLVNPTGRFVTGGPQGDTGLTGRKIIVDTYGGSAPHGGGAFSGKDATKVDRSASYAARWVAKNLVAAGLAGRCLVQVAYAIGVARPVSVMVETFGTARVDPATLGALVQEHFDLRPGAIIRDLGLRGPIFARTAAYGHFGRREPGFSWEETARADDLRRAAGL